MIYVDFLTLRDGRMIGFIMNGHAEAGEPGEDIVCAAVSSAAYLTANTITDIVHIPAEIDVGEGEMRLRIREEKDLSRCRDCLAGFRLHMTGLEEQYPDCISVNYLEV